MPAFVGVRRLDVALGEFHLHIDPLHNRIVVEYLDLHALGQREQLDGGPLLPFDRPVVDGAEAVVEFFPRGFPFRRHDLPPRINSALAKYYTFDT